MTTPADEDPGHVIDREALDARMTPAGNVPELPPPAMVIALLVMGQNAELELSPVQDVFTLGGAARPAVDLPLDDAGVSRLHARIERRGPKLRVIDQESRNGTHYRGWRDPDFEIGAGDRFRVAGVELLTLDDSLKVLRRRLLWMLGFDAHVEVDNALAAIGADHPLLILGPAGSEHRKLAAKIHERSAHRARGFAVATREDGAAAIAHARGTIFLDLIADALGVDAKADSFKVAPVPPELMGAVLSGRAIVAALSQEHAIAALGADRTPLLTPIQIPPIAARPDDVLRMIDALILQRTDHGPGKPRVAPLASLGRANLDGLRAYGWPGNFGELREAAEWLHAILLHRFRLRAAARSLGVPHSTFADRLARIGVAVKQVADDADDSEIDGASLIETGAAPTPPIGPSPR